MQGKQQTNLQVSAVGRVASWFALFAVASPACTGREGTRFAGASPSPVAVSEPKDQPAVPAKVVPTRPPVVPAATPTQAPEIVYTEPTPIGGTGTPDPESAFLLAKPVQTAFSDQNIWVVTDTEVYRFKVDPERSYPMRKWTKVNNWGNRTYVSEIGLLIGQSERNNAGGLFLVNDDNNAAVRIFSGTDLGMATESRLCVTSFRLNGVAYVGGGFVGTDGKRRFLMVPIDRSQPNSLDVSKKRVVEAWNKEATAADNEKWGYSCFIDQVNLRYWSTYSGKVKGLDLSTEPPTPLSEEMIPNKAQTLKTSSFAVVPQVRGSYAIAGDANGNVLNAHSLAPAEAGHTTVSYTFAHDPISNFVFGSSRLGKLYLTHASCFSTESSCPDNEKHFVFTSPYGNFGPLSSLNNGTVAGIIRGNTSQVFLLRLVNKDKPEQGLEYTPIGEVPNNAYMYTDFTGATLYAGLTETTFPFAESAAFRPGVAVKELKLTWKAEGGVDGLNWQGLTMSVRCYAQGATDKPAWTVVQAPAVSGTAFAVTAPGCAGKIDALDLKIEGDGKTNAFSRVEQVTLSAVQQ